MTRSQRRKVYYRVYCLLAPLDVYIQRSPLRRRYPDTNSNLTITGPDIDKVATALWCLCDIPLTFRRDRYMAGTDMIDIMAW